MRSCNGNGGSDGARRPHPAADESSRLSDGSSRLTAAGMTHRSRTWMRRCGGQAALGQFHDVPVMCKEDDLGLLSQVGQGPQCRGGPRIVKHDQDVIHDEWQRFPFGQGFFQARQAQGQVQLVAQSRRSCPRFPPPADSVAGRPVRLLPDRCSRRRPSNEPSVNSANSRLARASTGPWCCAR